MIIGITGQSGCGKSTVSKLLKGKGFFIIDCDKIYHQLLEKDKDMLEEIKNEFGTFCFDDGKLNRKRLGNIVFNDEKELTKLNKITHKYVFNEVEKLIEKTKNAVIDAPLLIESGLDKLCDKNIYISCPFEIRVERIMKRDNISKEYAVSRLCSQKEDNFYKEFCTYTVVNDGISDIKKQLKELID